MNSAKSYLFVARRILPEVIVVVMIAWQSLLFLRYLPTTNDDLAFATTGMPLGAWWRQNRASLLLSGHLIEFFSRSSFEIRNIYGLHVTAFYAPLAIIYCYLLSVGKRQIGLLAFSIGISSQVFGYDHTTPLAYPFTWSLGLSVITASALFGGRFLAREGARLRCITLVFFGTLFSAVYEPFSLIFYILFVLAFFVELGSNASPILRDHAWSFLLGIIPLLVIILSKLFLIAANSFYPGSLGPSELFSAYGGSNLDLSNPFRSLRVALNHFIGATILGHITSPLIWPPVTSYASAPRILQWPFSLLNSSIALLSLLIVNSPTGISSRKDSDEYSLRHDNSSLLLCIGFLLAAASMVVPAGFTAKYQTWLELSDYSWGHTFLTGSLSTSLGAVGVSSLVYCLIDKACTTRRRKRLAATVTTLMVFIMTQRTIDHNFSISMEIERRGDSLSRLIFYCRNDILNGPDAMAQFSADLPNLPHLKKLCSIVKEKPTAYSNWGDDIDKDDTSN